MLVEHQRQLRRQKVEILSKLSNYIIPVLTESGAEADIQDMGIRFLIDPLRALFDTNGLKYNALSKMSDDEKDKFGAKLFNPTDGIIYSAFKELAKDLFTGDIWNEIIGADNHYANGIDFLSFLGTQLSGIGKSNFKNIFDIIDI
jgi:hypothetical protein